MARDETPRLRVVHGDDAPKPYHRKGAPQQVVCRVCEADTGVATSEFVKTVVAPQEHRGRVGKGRPSLICAHCLARGKVTPIA